MAFNQTPKEAKLTDKQKEWIELGLQYMKTHPNKQGTLGFQITRYEIAAGNLWIDWLQLNEFRDAAKALARMAKNTKQGFMVPCRDPRDFALWMEAQGKRVKYLGARKPERPNRAIARPADFTDQAKEIAAEMCRSALGREARDAGWLIGLYEFCRDVKEYPLPHEIETIKATAAKVATTLDNPPGALAMAFEAAKERRAQIEASIFGTP